MRAFIAVELPAILQQTLHTASAPLRAQLGKSMRWVAPHNIHLTLKFLGEISKAQLDSLAQALPPQLDSLHPFDLHISGIGSFPRRGGVSVLWAGIQASAELEALFGGVESVCTRIGFPAEIRPFAPHLTLARARNGLAPSEAGYIRQALASITIDSLGIARVDSAHIYQSDLKPSGAIYSKLVSIHFKR